MSDVTHPLGDGKFRAKHWICDGCAKEKGWVAPSFNVTVTMGYCGWCENDKTKQVLTPTTDYKGAGKLAAWD